ncbi:CPCC family cysteine-rich protein [Kitasatospora sp. NPDC094019]|uniref:CPCC family cysteine-rich protein n=1 Tax=Kitasatospora sp. NPDC094019 TaxID=3364091 RepID=UPI00380E46DE
MDTRRPCPCCGHLTFDAEEGWPGSSVVCPVCSWEDDAAQLRRPFAPGANRVPLVEAQRNFREYGACDQRGRFYVRPPAADEPRAPEWRPIDPVGDVFEEWREDGSARPWPEDRSVLCWWLPTFWGVPEDPDPDPDRRVLIDVGAVLDDRGLHATLRRALGFPSFYGGNRNAFRDAVTGLVVLPAEIRFTGWPALERRAPGSAAALREELARYRETFGRCVVHYDDEYDDELSAAPFGPGEDPPDGRTITGGAITGGTVAEDPVSG